MQSLHVGPLPPPIQLADYEAVHPGTAQWIIDQAAKNAEHARTMELRALGVQRLDILLYRGLPFALICAFLIASVAVTYFSAIAGGIGLVFTMASVLIAYFTGRAPNAWPSDEPPQQ